MADEAWSRRDNETPKAYAAFLEYLKLPAKVRSMNRAYRATIGEPLESLDIIAPRHWHDWQSRNEWVMRASAYDVAQSEADLEKWEERRAKARERDWQQAEALRAIVDEALPSVNRFFRRSVGQPTGGTPTIVNQEGQVISQGTPAQVIVTVAFNVADMSKILMDASKLQRLVLDEPTDNINNLSGAALDLAVERALGQWALENVSDSGETPDAPYPSEEDPAEAEDDFDGGAEDGMG